MTDYRVERNIPKKKNRLFGLLIFAVVFSLLALFALNMPFLDLGNITIEGNEKLETQTIIEALGLDKRTNFFMFLSSSAKTKLLENPYIKSAVISKTFPNSVKIEITERVERCYVEYKNMNMFILIDEEGMVLDVHSYMQLSLPLIVGLSFSGFVSGEYLETDDNENFTNVVLISRVFIKYGLEDIVKFDVSDKNDIHIFIGGLDISFGDADDADEKIRTLRGILETFSAESRGFLDISNIKKPPVFSPLK